MWMTLLMACSTDAPVPEERRQPPAPVVVARTAPLVGVASKPVVVSRDPVLEATVVTGWGTDPEPCAGVCTPLQPRLQASSEAESDTEIAAASLAADEDLSTAWCAKGGAGQKLSLGMGTPRTVRRIRVAGWDGKGASLHEVRIVTDAGDRIPVTFEPPNGEWPALGDQAPAIDALLADVQFVQIEVVSLHGEGPVCIAEVLLLGE